MKIMRKIGVCFIMVSFFFVMMVGAFVHADKSETSVSSKTAENLWEASNSEPKSPKPMTTATSQDLKRSSFLSLLIFIIICIVVGAELTFILYKNRKR